MKLMIDTESQTIEINGDRFDLFSAEAFSIISPLWTQIGWSQKYSYGFSWLDVPIIQLPEDMIRYQEAIFRVQPDVIIETGVAHGGSAVFSASLCRIVGRGRVIAVDIEIRPHNRARIESHSLSSLITLVEGSSTSPVVLDQIRANISPEEKVLIVLDSNHSYEHVSQELEAYAPLVSPGSYIIATDGIMQELATAPGGQADWTQNNPARAARDFAMLNPDFTIEIPPRSFDQTAGTKDITYWPDAWLKRRAA